ncbi:DPP6 N-terminal domain-like protein [Rhynchospora pubera]|uniref:DPP6 N-terminal domain-like protein n=1 Tax=Rhynchospora pubera TaxID=906938 RepID=A0AAV8BPV1_9POAL|nr:DPP6 N-terminal domain-like protein [Rhynchospora pubera]
MEESRGSIAFFTTYRPPVPLDIFCCPVPPSSSEDEFPLTDGLSYNSNGQAIPPAVLKTILRRPNFASEAIEADIESGRLTGLIFVSERENHLETLQIALRFNDSPPEVKVFSLADVYGADSFNGVRMEDSGCFGGGYKVGSEIVDHSLIYVSTKEPVQDRRSPWTVVYKTNLSTGETERLTPPGKFDLNPSVSQSGKKIAVASFEGKAWDGEVEDLQTDIYVMNVEKSPSGLGRKRVIVNGGWPTWGGDKFIFFHRKVGEVWGVFRFNISTHETIRVTPEEVNAVTPAAVDETRVAVAVFKEKVGKLENIGLSKERNEKQIRHIEIFDIIVPEKSEQITQKIRPRVDHYNPFVIDGGKRIGYHRCNVGLLQNRDEIQRNFHEFQSPVEDVGLFRVSGAFPTISKDGSKLAFVDNEFKEVWLADSQGLRIVLKKESENNFFSPMWNQNPDKDTLYVCMGPSFHPDEPLQIIAIPNVSSGASNPVMLTEGSDFNNAFPSTNPEGTKLVFRSTRGGGDKRYKNLYIMEDATVGENGGELTRLTKGDWIDTQCQWSPRGDWIVFSSTRHKPTEDVPEKDHELDPGYYAVFLIKASDPTVVVRVIKSGYDIAGHVNHPVFSPDGRSLAITADLAAVSVDPVSLPLFLHSVRPYGDVFTVDIDPDDIYKNEDVEKFCRITHSRYENSTPTWTMFSINDIEEQWHLLLKDAFAPPVSHAHEDGGVAWHMSGHLCPKKKGR